MSERIPWFWKKRYPHALHPKRFDSSCGGWLLDRADGGGWILTDRSGLARHQCADLNAVHQIVEGGCVD